ncbi:MAG: hypothetical protein AVDCRST_MAG08-2242, partial [uncultured Acetobacteraceae bacterium]
GMHDLGERPAGPERARSFKPEDLLAYFGAVRARASRRSRWPSCGRGRPARPGRSTSGPM